MMMKLCPAGMGCQSHNFGSVGRVDRESQGKGGLFANESQKASQIPFF